ncbi:hypothetical protein D7B24_003096 [Verticillium nonalfalfae]|uniref:Uncharacterized protein n=1 Tax=Verticillium nonalfalfae TaxID=1051616 RepID=A0A3M9XXP1_9PEZI|nr:uncharacterized protein D7B24_003096 [Verticillium nonalfalfae]RNJ52675.1 hypothetical protein D7B24_003096 [Verticillium nonalfalfae]
MAYTKSVDELQELLRQAEQRAEDAERDRQEERQRAEREQERAEREQQRAEREQQRAEDAEEQTRLTTFIEYIVACHIHVFLKLVVETDKKLTSKGSITNPRNKWCPTHLRPWPDFLEQQRVIFGTLHDSFPTDSRLFESRGFLAGLGHRISQRPIANEKTLEFFLHNSVEDPVRTISEQLKQVESVRRAFDMGRGIVFENHPHAISDVAQEVADRQTPSTPQTPDHRHDLNQLRPDQICVYRSNDGPSESRTMVFVSEYKPPHKLTTPHLRLGLRAMNIPNDVVNRKTIPTSAAPDALFQYHAERLTASAVTQTYHYMIEGGLEYGLVTTGEAIVFLKVDWEEPETLYYHLAEPGPEVAAHPEHSHVCTAVEQSLDDGIRPLYVSGARGVLFQVTMIAYGYTFVGKGTVQAFIRDLEHEAAVYERLRSIQGANVPVFLGAIDLRPMKKIYYYDHRVTYQRHVGGKSSYVWSGSQLAYGTNGNVLRAGRWTGVNAREAG